MAADLLLVASTRHSKERERERFNETVQEHKRLLKVPYGNQETTVQQDLDSNKKTGRKRIAINNRSEEHRMNKKYPSYESSRETEMAVVREN
jgi:hypothetical protein